MANSSPSPFTKSDPPQPRWIGYALLGLVIIILAAYGTSLWHSEFTMLDDENHVFGNPLVNHGLHWEQVRAAFTQAQAGLWIPLTWLSLGLDVSVFGLGNPGALHLSNLLLHVLATLLLYRATKLLLGDSLVALIVAALFGLHPINVESVAWITERKNVLSAVFWMLSLGSYAKYAQRRRWSAWLASLGWFACGLMAKPAVVPLPCVFLLLDVWPLQRFSKQTALRLLAEKLPFFALIAAVSAITLHAHASGHGIVSLEQVSLATRFGYAAESVMWYLCKLVWPTSLAIFYPHPLTISWGPAIVCAIALAAITGVLCWQARRRPQWLVGWLWFVGALVPTLGIVQAGSVARADRFAYLPQIGLWIALAVTIVPLMKGAHARFAVLGSAGVALVLAAVTAYQATFWQDNVSLFERAVVVTPRNPLALRNAAMARALAGENGLAIRYYQAALKYEPNSSQTWNHLGVTLSNMGRMDQALTAFENSLRFNPEAGSVNRNAGIAALALNHPEQALPHLEAAVRLEPKVGANYYHLARAQALSGHRDDALKTLRTGISQCPGEAPLQKELKRMEEATTAE